MERSVNDMTRSELRAYMISSREINNMSEDSVAWKRAFAMFTENGGGPVDMDCPSCWEKVREWIEHDP